MADRCTCRRLLEREPDGLLAEGHDRKCLQTDVRLLQGIEGQYSIGSIRFSRPGADSPGADSPSPSMSDGKGSCARAAEKLFAKEIIVLVLADID